VIRQRVCYSIAGFGVQRQGQLAALAGVPASLSRGALGNILQRRLQMQPSPDFNPAVAAKKLLREGRSGALATLMPGSGDPYCSLVSAATAADGAPLLLISRLAVHTKTIPSPPRASPSCSTSARRATPCKGPASCSWEPPPQPRTRRRAAAISIASRRRKCSPALPTSLSTG